MAKAVRRVVTGHDAAGKAVVIMDGACPHAHTRASGSTATALWRTLATPADISVTADPISGHPPTPPPANGSMFRITEFPPKSAQPPTHDYETFARERGIPPLLINGKPPRHPSMHRTDSVDYAIVLEGEIDMLLDEDDVHLRAGDVVIQQGTNHAWVNNSDKPCRIVFVLIDAKR